MSIDFIKLCAASFSSSFVILTSAATRSSNLVFLLLRLLRLRRSLPVKPVSSSSSRPSSDLMSSSSRSVLSVFLDESDLSSSDRELYTSASRICLDLVLRCFFVALPTPCLLELAAPAIEALLRRAWFVGGSSITGVGGWISWATPARDTCKWSFLEESEAVDDGGFEKVVSGNSSAGCKESGGGLWEVWSW